MRHLVFGLVMALSLSISAAGLATGVGAGPFAYITNSGSNSVSVIDSATNTVAAVVPGGTFPHGVAANPAGTRVYVTNMWDSTISVLDTATNTRLALVPVGWFPYAVAVSPAGTRVYVTNLGDDTVSVIDASNTVIATVPVGSIPRGVAVAPDGTRVYVAVYASSFGTPAISVIDAASNRVTAEVPLAGSGPLGLAVNPSGTRLYATNSESNTLSVINAATNALVATVAVGMFPFGVAVNPAGTRVYVTNGDSDSVSVIDAASNSVIATVSLPMRSMPRGIGVLPDGTRVYVANWGSDSVSVIDTASNTVRASVRVGSQPVGFGRFFPALNGASALVLTGVAPNPVTVGSSGPVTFTATLTFKNSGDAIAGATIHFLVDGVPVGSRTTGTGGVASWNFNPSALAPGAHAVQATFAGGTVGGATVEASTSGVLTLHVQYTMTWLELGRQQGRTERKAGSTVPVMWHLTDANGRPVTSASAVSAIRIGQISCGGGAVSSAAVSGVRDASSMGTLHYGPSRGSSQFIFLWQTQRSWAGYCYRFMLTLNDGVTYSIDIEFK